MKVSPSAVRRPRKHLHQHRRLHKGELFLVRIREQLTLHNELRGKMQHRETGVGESNSLRGKKGGKANRRLVLDKKRDHEPGVLPVLDQNMGLTAAPVRPCFLQNFGGRKPAFPLHRAAFGRRGESHQSQPVLALLVKSDQLRPDQETDVVGKDLQEFRPIGRPAEQLGQRMKTILRPQRTNLGRSLCSRAPFPTGKPADSRNSLTRSPDIVSIQPS